MRIIVKSPDSRRFAKLDGTTVENTIFATPDFIKDQPGTYELIPDGVVVSPGDSFIDGEFVQVVVPDQSE